MKHFRLTLISFVITFLFSRLSFSQVIQSEIEYSLSSGLFDGTNLTEPTNLFYTTINHPDAQWLRIKFNSVNLGRNSYLIIRSLEDDLWQKLNSESIEHWYFSSAYFNGNSVEISLFVGPGDKGIYFNTSNLIVGEGVVQIDNLCGDDNRVSSDHDAVGRICKGNFDPWGTGWILYDGRIVTAGHVIDPWYSGMIIEFNVPDSYGTGSPRHPGPEHQYSINNNSIIFNNDGDYSYGDDYAIMGVFPNSNTDLLPKEAQNAFFQVEQNNNAQTIRVTGYGYDEGAAYCIQQTDVGPNTGTSGNVIGYQVDVMGGNSGSPVINNSNGKVIGIHTDGYCNPNQLGYNVGTSFVNSSLWNEINPEIDFVIHQKKNAGTELVGTYIGRWIGSQSSGSFQNYPVTSNGALIDDLEYGDYETFRGNQEKTSATPYEKYNTWSVNNISLPDVANHQKFLIDYPMSEITSQFDLIYGNVAIKNEFPEVPGLNPLVDIIEFKDPWLTDYEDPEYYGTNYRNRGILAPFKSRTSPFYPNYDTYYGSDKYIGIFLDQTIQGGNYYSARSPIQQSQLVFLSQTSMYHKLYFYNWSWSGTDPLTQNNIVNGYYETPVVFRSGDAVINANLKGTQLTNTTAAYSNTSQRKALIVNQSNSPLYNIYESMGKVWLESSTDNGTSWRIENNGRPINNGSGARCPSIFAYSNTGPYFTVTFQELIPNSTSSKVIIASYYNETQQLIVIGEFTIPNTSNISLNPTTCFGNDGTIVTTYEKNGTLECRFGFWMLGTYPHIVAYWSNYSCILFEYNYSEMAQVVGMEGLMTKYHLVAKKTTGYDRSDIVYKKFRVQRGITGNYNPNDPNDAYPVNEIIESIVSNGSGGSLMNIRPSISLANNYPVVSWITGYYSYNDITTSRVLTRRGSSWGATNSSGYQAKYVNNNSANSTTEKTVIVYSENNGGYITKWIKRTGTSFTTPLTLSHSGIKTQVTNGSDFQYMNAIVFNQINLPYFFTKSTTDFSGNQSEGGLEKITIDDTLVTFGRSGIAAINNIEFVFEIGDILVGDSIIKFIDIPDTLIYFSSTELNQHTRTNNFTLNTETNFYFSNIYYVVTKSDPESALSNTDAVNFKAELVNALTNQVIGTFDNIIYNKSNLEKYASIDYEVDCSGITAGDYFLRLVTSVNTDAAYGLANIVSDNNTLAKKNFNKVNFTGSEIPITYELSNNFPNPFNPSTTIRYQIPQDGIVTLKIYDILGSEVATLVNEEKVAGKYEVNFNASALASGVYIYKIQAGSFINSKKMILLK